MRTVERIVMMAVGMGVMGAYASPASACETDADCDEGYVCKTYEYTMPDCPDMDRPDCAPDDPACEVTGEEKYPECDDAGEVVVESYCEPAPCETDEDCGEDMVCIEYVDSWCSGSDEDICDDDGECEIIEEEPVCGEDIHRECGYPYQGDCEEDADCGEGFKCVPEEICWCTSSDPAAVNDDGAAEPMPTEEPECGCEASDENYCQLQEIECLSDDDCPAGLECAEGFTDEDCWGTEDGIVDCKTYEEPPMCRPIGWYGDDAGTVKPVDDGEIDGSSDSDVDVDIDIDDEEAGNDDNHRKVHPININVFFGGCAVSTPAEKSTGLMDMLSLLAI